MTTARTSTIHSIQQALAGAALVVVAALAWGFLVASANIMASMRSGGLLTQIMTVMMDPGAVLPYLAVSALMWVVMMIAMMTPSVLPMMLVFRGMDRGASSPFTAVTFAAGYLAIWSGFALLAAVLQWWLHQHGLLHGHLLGAGNRMAGAILIAAGLWQFTPLKAACLAHCRGPLSFFMNHWRDGRGGAFVMGLHHGCFCIGCCWMLMLLMFAGGAMSVLTMAALSVFILAERVLPAGPWLSKLPGVALIVLGAGLAAAD